MAETKKKIGRYQIKKRAGLVPSRYDRDSKSFNEGAHRHWARVHPSQIASVVANDREFLKMARERR